MAGSHYDDVAELLALVDALPADGVIVPRAVLMQLHHALLLGLDAEHENIPQPSTRAGVIDGALAALDALLKS